MRLVLSLIALVALFSFASRAAAEEPRALLDRAIAAHGGSENLEKTKKGRIKAKMEGDDRGIPFKVTWEETFDLPQRYHRTIDRTIRDASHHLEYVIDGKKGWLREGTGPTIDLPGDESNPASRYWKTVLERQPLPLTWHWQTVLAQLPLLRDKDTQLSSVPDETKDGRVLVGFKAVSPRIVSTFYFDKTTALLARAQWVLPTLLPGDEVTSETIYEDYRDVQGVRYPMRIRAGVGKVYSITTTVTSFEILDSVDQTVFAKPPSPPPDKQPPRPVQEKPKPKSEPEPTVAVETESPARWDVRLIAATVGVGVFVAAVWLYVRVIRKGPSETPAG
jgi:hypothetical protein